jgi:TPR repeat protein
MYAKGLGVKADLNQALAWFRAAEKSGNAQATPRQRPKSQPSSSS